ncbi:MAG TPA: class I SAM-dependent methyltransferase [Parafilimonas sp.]|nr:class I SAM-dependent methyltransferase [Parafilimonas sp.]
MNTNKPEMNFNPSYVGLRMDLLSNVEGEGKQVLDVGCATGANGKYLLDKNIASTVYGIEMDEKMAAEAGRHYKDVIVGNLDDHKILQPINTISFDLILLGDVLEHLDDPWKMLNDFANLLNRNGEIIISLPNIQHIDVWRHIYIKGTWPVNSRGIFDKTHKRFFTLKDIRKLVAGAGLQITEVKRNFRFRDAIGSRFPIYGPLLVRMFKNLYTFQYIIVCRRA